MICRRIGGKSGFASPLAEGRELKSLRLFYCKRAALSPLAEGRELKYCHPPNHAASASASPLAEGRELK